MAGAWQAGCSPTRSRLQPYVSQVREMALDAVEPSADNREVQVQFQAEIGAACRLNGVRHGGSATATASGAASEVS